MIFYNRVWGAKSAKSTKEQLSPVRAKGIQ